MSEGNYDELSDGVTASIVRDLAVQAAGYDELVPGTIYAWLSPQTGHVQMVDLTDDKYLDLPKRKKGLVTVDDVPSFALFHAKHKLNGQTEVFAHPGSATVTAVLDGHSATQAHWQGHRVQLKLRLTDEWQAWTGMDRQMMPQVEFAEFLEDHISDIASSGGVSAARLLEVAQEFTAHTQVQFSAAQRLRDGQTQIQYTETIDAAGNAKNGAVAIPQGFSLGIRPYYDCDAMEIHARLRFRIVNRQLKLGYFLDQPKEMVKDAFDAVVAKVREATGEPVMYGIPPSS